MTSPRNRHRASVDSWRAAALWEYTDFGWLKHGPPCLTLKPGETHEQVIAELREETPQFKNADLVLVESL